MQYIDKITSSPNQRMTLILDNGENVDFHIYYSARMLSWYFDFTYNDLTSKGNKIVLTPNALRNFKKLIPFGFGFVATGAEPFSLDDFSTERVKLYVLNQDEVDEVEQEIFNE